MLLSYLMGVDILHLMKAEGGDSSLDSAWYKQVKNLPPRLARGGDSSLENCRGGHSSLDESGGEILHLIRIFFLFFST